MVVVLTLAACGGDDDETTNDEATESASTTTTTDVSNEPLSDEEQVRRIATFAIAALAVGNAEQYCAVSFFAKDGDVDSSEGQTCELVDGEPVEALIGAEVERVSVDGTHATVTVTDDQLLRMQRYGEHWLVDVVKSKTDAELAAEADPATPADQERAEAVVADFVQALEEGDRKAACRQLRPRILIEWPRVFGGPCIGSAGAPDPAWFEDWEVQNLALDPSHPVAQLVGRFNLGQITFERYSETGRWYILDIENFAVTKGSPPVG